MTDVEELALHCLERLPGEGRQAIEAVCREHPEHAGEIRGMVRHLQRFGLLEQPRPEQPESIGSYRILERIGTGGMGVVYLAEDEGLGRRVALKLIRSDQLFHDSSRKRFAREMQAASRLEHPNLCTIYEAGDADGVPYLAMRYVEGRSLADWIEERRASVGEGGTSTTGRERIEQLLDWFAQLASGLHAAHEAGFVHRDVKPENVILARDGTPVLLDFGLAHVMQADQSHALTASGALLGTPAYMAPEQIQDQGTIDRRTDVYALGVTLYECLTNRLPFPAKGREALFRQILKGDAPPPSRLVRSIPADLSLVVETALARHPGERYASARALAEDLGRIRRFEPIVARRPPLWLRVQRWTQRHPVASVAMALLLVSLTVALVLVARLQDSLVAERQAKRSLRARALALEALASVDKDPLLSVERALEAYDVEPGFVTRSALYAALARSHESSRTQFEHRLAEAFWVGEGEQRIVVRTTKALWLMDGSARKELVSEYVPAALSLGKGRLIVARLGDGSLRTWDADGRPGRSLQLEHPVNWIGGHPDHSLLLCLGWAPGKKRQIDLCDLQTGTRIPLEFTERPIAVVCFAPDGSRLAIADGLRVWQWLRDGTALEPFQAHEQRVTSLSYTDPDRLVTSSIDGTHRVWDLSAPRPELHGRPLDHGTKIGESYAGRDAALLTKSRDGFVDLWDVERGQHRWRKHTYANNAVAMSRDGSRVAMQRSTTVQILGGEGVVQAELHHASQPVSIRFSRDGGRIVTTSLDRTVRTWDLSPPGMAVLGHGALVRQVDWAGKRILSAAIDGKLRVWRARDGSLELEIPFPGSGDTGDLFCWARFVPGSDRILAGSLDRFWLYSANGQLDDVFRIPTAKGPLDFPRGGLSPNGTRLVNCTHSDQSVRVLSLAEKQWSKPFFLERKGNSAAFVDEGRHIAVGDRSGWVNILDADSVEPVRPSWQAHKNQIGMIAAVPGTDEFVTTAFDKVAYRWDIEGRKLQAYRGHTKAIKGCAVSGDLLATASYDRTLRLWNLTTGECLAVLEGHRGIAFDVRFSPDGRYLVSSSGDGTARVWPVETRDLLAIARNTLEQIR